jgi:hypothetical protein
MNVQNRRLFRNKDARRQLAAMGGIMQSSPELMGEAMRFANGGGVELSYIVSNIPGLVDQYEYVRVDVPTMQLLNDRFPQLMQQATVEEESMVPSGVRTRARPQTILGSRISRMMETQQAAPEEVVLESAPSDMSLMDRIRSTVQSAETVPLLELPEVDFQKLDRDIGSSIQAADRAVQGKLVEVLGDVYQIIADDIRGDLDRIKIIRASTGAEVTDPAIKQAVLSDQRIAGEDMAMAQDVPQGQPRNFTQLLSDIENPVERGKAILAQSQIDQATPYNPMVSGDPRATMGEFMRGTGLPAAPEIQETTVDEALIALEDRYKAAIANAGSYDDLSPQERMGFSAEYSMVYPDRVLVGNDRTPEEVARVTESLLPPARNPAFDSFGGDLLRPVDLMAGPIYPAEESSSETKAKRFNDALSNRPRMYGTMFPVPDPEPVTLDLGPEGSTTSSNGERTPIEFAVKPGSADAAALGSAGYTPDAAKDVALAAAVASTNPDANLPSTISTNLGAGSSSSIEEATKAQYKFLKDFLGIGERDKQKEFNLMAMQFFTALAAGQSPDALANLNAAASTAIAGLAAADKERTELDRSIKLAAFDRASELDSAAAARRQRMDELTKEYQLRTDLEISKIEADAANTPGKAFLSTETGKALLAEYKLYIDPASGGLTPDQAFEKMTSSGGVARDPALITLFMKSLGYTSNNQGETDGATKFDQRQKKGT